MAQTDILKALFPSLPDSIFNGESKDDVVANPTIIPYHPDYTPEPKPAGETTKVVPFVTGEQLQNIVLNITSERAANLAKIFNEVLPKYGLNHRGVFHEYIAQVAHESGGFRYKKENLNYASKNLLKVFKKYFKTKTQADAYHRKPERIANYVYANRMGNGGPKSGDGWRYRGGGFIQLTGKFIYSLYAEYIGKSIEETAELVRTDDYYAIDSSCWYYCIYASLLDESEKDLFKEITKAINGGYNGYQDREDFYERAKEFLPIAA